MKDYILFAVDVFLHILVDVKMIRREVCDYGNVGTFAHGDQLEAGKLYHSKVLRLDFFYLRQKRFAYISA